MRWARYESKGKTYTGIVEGSQVEAIEGDMFGDYKRTGQKVPLDSVKLLVPLVPQTFYAAGLNYVEHIMEQAKMHGREPNIPEKPDIGYRANNALVAHGENVVVPKDATDKVQYEAEIVVIIGKKAKHLTEANALSCVFGYTIGNDVSERTWQKGDRTFWRAKNTDTFKPMGPWIETDVDLDTLKTTVRVDGKVTIEFPTNNMLYGIQRYIAAMTKYLTLHPGDMIWMGTEGSSPDVKDGQTVEIEINQIGTLSNRFVRET
jgi:2-keto-4-pentenoate hydratase/2-oxohepta-3-ene-1,7-dioic acid hydratase in catechol pathway